MNIFKKTYLLKKLYFLLGFFVPFVVIGPEISSHLWFAPSIPIGFMLGALAIMSGRVSQRLLILVLMVVVFALTAIARHSISSYALSLAALFVVMIPLTITPVDEDCIDELIDGFVKGFIFTVVLVLVEFFLQIGGFTNLHRMQTSMFRGYNAATNPHNFIGFYYRPMAAFPEPSHLGIYLAFSYVIFDQLNIKNASMLKTIAFFVMLIVGSLVSIFLVASYILATLLKAFISARFFVFSKKRLKYVFSIILFVALIAVSFIDEISAFGGHLASRISRMFFAMQNGLLISSEGSRVNAILAVPTYWADSGVVGVLFGTGYGNSENWLISTYGHLGAWSTFGRGQIDNLLAAIVLSTGLVGLLVYGVFMASIFSRFPSARKFETIVFVLVSHFAMGMLITYFLWHLIAILVMLNAKAFQYSCVR